MRNKDDAEINKADPSSYDNIFANIPAGDWDKMIAATIRSYRGLPVVRDVADPRYAWMRIPWAWVEALPNEDKEQKS